MGADVEGFLALVVSVAMVAVFQRVGWVDRMKERLQLLTAGNN